MKSIILVGANPMGGLGIVISGATSVGKIMDARTNPGHIAFIVCNTGAKSLQINSPIDGELLNGTSLGGVIFPSDIDGDGVTTDTTSLFFGGGVNKAALNGTVFGGAIFGGPVKKFTLTNGDLVDDTVILGDAGKITLTNAAEVESWIWKRLFIDGDVKCLDMSQGRIIGGALVDITGYLKKASFAYIDAGSADIFGALDDLAAIPVASFDPSGFGFFYTPGATLRVGDGIKDLTVSWFTPGDITYDTATGGSLVEPTTGTDQRYFLQYIMSNVLSPQIGRLNVLNSMVDARVLAGADLGADLLPGGFGPNADSYDVGHIGQLNVGLMAKNAYPTYWTLTSGGTDPVTYGSGIVADSLVGAGVFLANVPGLAPMGGSGYNLVPLHDGFLFEDGSSIGKVNILTELISSYNDPEAAGDDFSTATPPLIPYFVPFGIGSYQMGSVMIGGVAVSPVAVQASFGIWPRFPFLFVEIPRGLGANA